jgi:integrase
MTSNTLPTQYSGNVRRRADGKWVVRYRLPSGVDSRRVLDCQTEQEAQEALQTIFARFKEWAPGTDALFSVLAAEFLTRCETRGLRQDTITRYKGIIEWDLLPALGEKPLTMVSKREIILLHDSLSARLAPASVNQTKIVFSGIVSYARRARDYVGTDPSEWFERARNRPQESLDVLNVQEVELVANSLDNPYAVIVRTAAYAGLRLSELRELRWQDVDFAGSKITVCKRYTDLDGIGATKSGKIRVVPMASRVASELKLLSQRERYTEPGSLVFCTMNGGHLSGDRIYRKFVSACSRSGLRRLSFHSLRHTAGSLWIQKFDLRQVQEWLGHASITTTSRYLHYQPRGNEAKMMDELLSSTDR